MWPKKPFLHNSEEKDKTYEMTFVSLLLGQLEALFRQHNPYEKQDGGRILFTTIPYKPYTGHKREGKPNFSHFFEKLLFRTKTTFSKFSSLVFKVLVRFRDGLEWTLGLTVEVKLAYCGRCLRKP